ncbi:hypothetical protein FQN60_015868, partial [Etheostoma spectabile]
MANKKIPFKYTRPVEDWLQEKGRQLTIFNTQATISIGGNDRKRPYQGQLSGLYYNGLKVLNMAAEGHVNIKVNGSVRLVGDVPVNRGAARTTTSVPPEMSTTFIETTTTLSTTTTRKQRSPPTIQVRRRDAGTECIGHDNARIRQPSIERRSFRHGDDYLILMRGAGGVEKWEKGGDREREEMGAGVSLTSDFCRCRAISQPKKTTQ